MIVTIDGPSGTGKTTIARLVAHKLGFHLVDSGALYRAVTWQCMRDGIDPKDPVEIEEMLNRFAIDVQSAAPSSGGSTRNSFRYFVQGKEITEAIRSQEVTALVSIVAAHRSVRDFVGALQKQYAKQGNIVVEGRDIGTVVFPDAEIKIFLTADPDVRAQRRLLELLSKSSEQLSHLDLDKVKEQILERDTLDSTREIGPLRCPPDAYSIDTSHLTIEEVVEKILHYVEHWRSSSHKL